MAPSGLQAGSPPVPKVRTSPLATVRRAISLPRTNAICVPSGDHAAAASPVPSVRRRAAVPSRFVTNSAVPPLTAAVYASCPSGDHVGSVAPACLDHDLVLPAVGPQGADLMAPLPAGVAWTSPRAYAICVPSGDHAGVISNEVPVSRVSRRTVPVARSST